MFLRVQLCANQSVLDNQSAESVERAMSQASQVYRRRSVIR